MSIVPKRSRDTIGDKICDILLEIFLAIVLLSVIIGIGMFMICAIREFIWGYLLV